ncbi:MAG: MEKHLA domain-containing protein [Desulfotalea sp.]
MKTPKTVGYKKAEKHVEIILKSYDKFFAEPIVSNTNDPSNALEELWSADFVVVSHGIETDPIFNFGNRAALSLFELDFSEFTQLPSRKSAGKVSQTERNELLAEVSKSGCIKNYTGVRVSSTGKRFFIENAKVWNLYDENSEYYGQAAMFKSWKRL